ncbi:MAG: sle, partial [Myxococcaceae bacterium]|nr:sle [Myxococcaceae bacterium]
ELVLDVRKLSDDSPEQALEAVREFFAHFSQQAPDRCQVVLVTRGASQVAESDPCSPVQAAACGFARSVAAENPAWSLRIADLAYDDTTSADDIRLPSGKAPRVTARRSGIWYRQVLEELAQSSNEPSALRTGLTYLIVGGAGGLGLALSKELAASCAARIGWIGRRPLDAAIRAQMREVEQLGGTVHYESADVASGVAAKLAVGAIRRALGPISVAVHSAMVLDDVRSGHMTQAQLERVMRPKVRGIQHLYAALEGEPIERLIVFSSMAALLDSPGQAAYAAASSYLDTYSLELRRRYEAPIHVVNWGYWGSVGAVAGGRYSAQMAERGVGSIEPAAGFACLRQQISLGVPHAVVLNADQHRFPEYGLTLHREPSYRDNNIFRLAGQQGAPTEKTMSDGVVRGESAAATGSVGRSDAVAYVQKTFAKVLKMESKELDTRETFDSFGVDSLLGMDILRALREDLGKLPATLLYERLTIEDVGTYLHEHHAAALVTLLSPAAVGSTVAPVKVARVPLAPPQESAPVVPESPDPAPNFLAEAHRPLVQGASPPVHAEQIAIVGVSGRYPDADDLETFWANLSSGRRSIREVSSERWDARPFFDPTRKKNRTYNTLGGFLSGVNQFDPQFFGILPSDAAAIDPQERLFLEVCWDLLEQAGHNGSRTRDRDTGVFVGVMYGSYGQIAAAEGWSRGEFGLGHSPYWSIANRVSYQFDLSGPSLAVDTACSSSLTAIHLACDALRRGECRYAIAGGVSLILHPAHHVALSAMNMLGTGEACRTFDASADGIVPGEGVGAVLLRPLADAIADGDEIWAVIRGSMINASGKTGGYTVPSASAQAAVVRRALERAGVQPSEVGCVEVHGTGTQLGDPIEVAALNQVFGNAAESQSVYVGSVKANIGHLEGAAGIAGLTKAVLQLRHAQVAPCAGLGELNTKVDFAGSVQPARELRAFPTAALRPDGTRPPCTTGVSSFGAGGANAHVIVEAWRDKRRPTDVTQPRLFVLSARNHEQLRQYATSVAEWLTRHPDANLAQLCFTSQVGRRPLA